MSVPETYRPLIGIWSDAAWTPQLCAALIVETVAADGTATITYAFRADRFGKSRPRRVLHGTGIVRDGELKFQNNDGSQYAFKPFYADLAGRLTTPQRPELRRGIQENLLTFGCALAELTLPVRVPRFSRTC